MHASEREESLSHLDMGALAIIIIVKIAINFNVQRFEVSQLEGGISKNGEK